MKKLLLAAAAVPVILSGCAASPEASAESSARRSDAEFTTGSNIPRRSRMGGDNVNVMNAEEFEKARAGSGQGSATSGGSQ